MADVVLRGRSEPMASAPGVVRKVVRTGQGGGLVITGEAGIGKSALLTAVLREAGRLPISSTTPGSPPTSKPSSATSVNRLEN